MNFTKNENYKVTGIMSGTSLDGMDLAACNFLYRNGNWEYRIEHATTYPYTPEWKIRLHKLIHSDAKELAQAHFDFGKLTGEFATRFHLETGFEPMLVASHGHTIFHAPAKGYTLQIGNGAAIASSTGKPVICDFRATDVCLSGQGAPLVPLGDQLLFHQYDACLNLGGFSNISFNRNGKRIAFDICPVNTILNRTANELGHEFDKNGGLAGKGKLIPELLEELNNLQFYYQPPPKSLGMEWLESTVFPILDIACFKSADKLRTLTEHICLQIQTVIDNYKIQNILLSGGGTFNKFLVNRLMEMSDSQIVLPGIKTIEYKEALIFALLGLLRWFGQPNCLASATGATGDSIAGAVYMPVK